MKIFDAAMSYKKTDITSLDFIDLKNDDIMDGVSDDGKIKFKYILRNNWKYTVKAEVLSAIKDILDVRPTTTKVKVYSDKEGKLKVMPLD
jgi:hypothetical protein